MLTPYKINNLGLCIIHIVIVYLATDFPSENQPLT